MLRRTQQVNPQLLRCRRRKRAAVSVFAGTFVGRAPVRFSRFPIYMLVGNPERLDIHTIQNRCQLLSCCRDLPAARLVGRGIQGTRRQQKKQE